MEKKANRKSKSSEKTAEKLPEQNKTNIETANIEQKKSLELKKILNKKFLTIAMSLILILLVVYYFKSLVIAAVVNGEPIYRPEVIKSLEKKAGKQEINSIISEMLIMQEAKRQKVEVTEEEQAAEIKKIQDNLKAQGQDLDQALAAQGMTKEDFNKQIKIQKTIEKLLGSKIVVSDDEINKFLEDNKEALPQDGDQTQLREDVRQQLIQQKMSQEFSAWLTGLRAKANITYFVNY